MCIGDEFECSPVIPVTWNPVTAQMIGRKAGRIGTILYRFRRHATNDREQPQCPRCAELERSIQERIADIDKRLRHLEQDIARLVCG